MARRYPDAASRRLGRTLVAGTAPVDHSYRGRLDMLEGARRITLFIVVVAVFVALALIAILPKLQGPGARPSGSGAALVTANQTPAATGSSAAPATLAPTQPAATATAHPNGSPVPEPPVMLVGAGDIAVCGSGGDSATAALLDDLEGTVFTLGDNAYESGTRLEYENCYDPTWGQHFDRTRPAPGNHEYSTAGATGYYGYFGERAGDPGKGYYAYDLGAWRIYSLNSNCAFVACGPASAQVAWLKEDMLANPRDCTLAFWHHPRYSSGRHGNEASTDTLWDVLYDAGAEIVVAGHDHSYERFAPMDDGGDLEPGTGIVSFVVGTGGRDLYEFHDILSTSRKRNATTWGVLELALSPGEWRSRFVPVEGRSFTDTANGTCH